MKHEALASAVTAIDDHPAAGCYNRYRPFPSPPGLWPLGRHSGDPAAGIWHLGAVAAVPGALTSIRQGMPWAAAGAGHNGSHPTRRRGARALYPWQPGSPPCDPSRASGKWQLSTDDSENADHPGRCRSAWSGTQPGHRGPVPFFGPFRSPWRGKPTALPSMHRQ